MKSSQLCLDLLTSVPLFDGVNGPSARKHTVTIDHADVSGDQLTPKEILSRMVVDDRALGLGMTTWNRVIDAAIRTGHTEIYESEKGVFGLRKPSYRFGPIARMPAIALEYVRTRTNSNKQSA